MPNQIYLPAVKQLPLAAPKVEKTTNTGTTHDNGYSTLSPKVCVEYNAFKNSEVTLKED